MLIWGTRLFGKCDRVKGAFYVATTFFHLWFFPLIPTKTWLVLDQPRTGRGHRVIPLPLSLKSVALGYLRAILIVASVMLLPAILSLQDGEMVEWARASIGVAALAALIASYLFTKPSTDRLVTLMTEAGFEQDFIDQVAKERDALNAEQLRAAGQFTPTGF